MKTVVHKHPSTALDFCFHDCLDFLQLLVEFKVVSLVYQTILKVIEFAKKL